MAAVTMVSCEPTLTYRPSEVKAKGFTLALKVVNKGPELQPRGERVRYAPATGMAFLAFTLTIRNDQPQRSLFAYDRCNLDIGVKRTEPIFVQMDGPNAVVDQVEEIAPGAEIARTLVFSYPQDQAPTRLSCGEIIIPLP